MIYFYNFFSTDTDSSGTALCSPVGNMCNCVSATDSSSTYQVLTKIICFGLQGLLIDKFNI